MGKKILVIEDEDDIRSYIMTLFEDHDYEALGAGNGREGLELARKEAPDLITLDISMPEKSGMKALRELQEDPATAGLPVVIVTGVSDDLQTYIQHRKQLKPPAAYVFKPIERQELLQTVHRLLA